eukprot:COSAG02_NODE_2295_length_9197_cov_20.855463_7_plen_147_part_00
MVDAEIGNVLGSGRNNVYRRLCAKNIRWFWLISTFRQQAHTRGHSCVQAVTPRPRRRPPAGPRRAQQKTLSRIAEHPTFDFDSFGVHHLKALTVLVPGTCRTFACARDPSARDATRRPAPPALAAPTRPSLDRSFGQRQHAGQPSS